MANIKTVISKEVEKGNLFVNKVGDFVSEERIAAVLRKSYVKGLNDGSIAFEKPFNDYMKDEMEKSYIPVSAVEKVLEDLFPTEVPKMPEPMTAETEETVAN